MTNANPRLQIFSTGIDSRQRATPDVVGADVLIHPNLFHDARSHRQ